MTTPDTEPMNDSETSRLAELNSRTARLVLACVSNGKRLEVMESPDHRLKVVLRDHYTNVLIASKTFRDCETQHHDSERWLSDKVGWPNDFAGILSERSWDRV